MIEFTKYNDIENTYKNNWIEKVKLNGLGKSDIVYACYRKIDGSNFQIFLDSKNEFKFGSRTMYVDNEDSFKGWSNVIERYNLKEKVLDMRNEIFKKSFDDEKLNSWIDLHKNVSFILYGELYGGAYYHKDVNKNVNAQKIIGRISYSPNNEFIAFDAILIDEETSEKYLMNLDTLKYFCNKFDIFYQIEEFRGTLDQCLNFKIDEINDDTGNRFFGFPIIDKNTIEGVVIKPIEPLFIGCSRVIFKNKNEKFIEKSRVSFKTKADPILKNEMENYWFSILKSYMNENRVMSAVSKVGHENFGDLIKEAAVDAINDFKKDNIEKLKEYENQYNKFEFDFSNVTKAFNKFTAPIVRSVFLKLKNN